MIESRNFCLSRSSLLASIFLFLALSFSSTVSAQVVIDVDVVHFRQANPSNQGPEISAFPNPASSIITLQTNGDNMLTNIRVLDMNGRLVISQETSGTKTRLNLSSLPSQPYILELHSQQGITRKRIIKQ